MGDLTGGGVLAAAWADAAPGMGCAPCYGYELTANLDLDTNSSGAADDGDAYWNDGDGWLPIGAGGDAGDAELHGNGHTISNLYVNRRNDANVTGNHQAGALAGVNAGIIYAAYTTGQISANTQGDGIVGRN